MTNLHEDFMYEINEIRSMFPNIPNNAEFMQKPNFDCDIAANTLFVFKDYKNREIILRMNYIPNVRLYAVDITEFPKDIDDLDKDEDKRYQSGYFTLDGRQLGCKFKQQNNLAYLVEIVSKDEINVKPTYYNLVKSLIQFYRQLFPQWQ